jgi:Fe-S cluster assembly protein SufD
MPLLERPSRLTPPGASSHTHGMPFVPDQSRAERRRSTDPADFPLPTGREEEWRFTPMAALTALLDAHPADGTLEWEVDGDDRVEIRRLDPSDAQALGLPAPGDRPAAIAVSQVSAATHVDIPAGLELATPVRIRRHGDGHRALSHVVVTVGDRAHATVLFEQTGDTASSEVLSVIVGAGASLTLVTVQEWDDTAIHLGEHDLVVGRDATARHIAVTLGGKLVRLNTNVTYAGPGGTFEGYGLYFADAGQHLEHRLFVDHDAPHCTSHVEYKGALQGASARSVWVGDVLIRAQAEGTQTYEINRNLVLTEGAQADSVPNLEIETGQIRGAGHAAATGRFDDEQLFYLQARGIPEAEARRLVVRGFFADIIAKIPVAEVQGHLTQAIERELASTAYATPETTA